MFISFPNNGRKAKKMITGILKAGRASEVKRMNYIQSYTLQENTIIKNDEKCFFIEPIEKNEEKILSFLQKNFPEAKIIGK